MRRPWLRIVIPLFTLLAILLAAWLLRFRVAETLIHRKLAAARVPASYHLTRLGPFRERVEDLRVGDPSAPDLVARSVDLSIGYTRHGPVVRSLRADQVRIAGRIGRNGLSLGSLDRLLPRSRSGAAALPDLHLALHDARLTLATPAGLVTIMLDGSGNPQGRFAGRARLAAPALQLASCFVTGVRADLRVATRSGAPSAAGAVGIGHAACPETELAEGRAALVLRSDAALRSVSGQAALSGFAGHVGTARFASIAGPVRGSGAAGAWDLAGKLTLADAAAPAAIRALVSGGPSLAGFPVAPTLARGRAALARLLADADVTVAGLVRLRGGALRAEMRNLALAGKSGGRLAVAPRGGVSWSAEGVRLDADVRTWGGAMPQATLHLAQAAPGSSLTGSGSLSPYRAGNASLAAPTIRFASADGRTSFDLRLRADGPIGDGDVRGLALPVRGSVESGGAFAIGAGCETLTADRLRIGAFAFADIRLPVCGRPILAGTAPGAVRLSATAAPVQLRGRTNGGAPVAISARSATLSGQGFALHGAVALLGDGAAPTRIAAATLDGSWMDGGADGAFAGATARIGAVPLALDDGAGRWRFGQGVLALTGGLRVLGTDEPARFRPLDATEATLTLEGDTIRAAAVLREPTSRAAVARVDIAHDLANGNGRALLAVDALRFAPRRLQPDAITPATLGVIANVSGTIAGNGRIDWTPRGVTSSGAFATDGLDFAAAFGPVTGLRGRIVFTDLLNLVSAPDQRVTVAQINPGVVIADGVVRFSLPGQDRVTIEGAHWPFAHGTLRLEPTTIDLGTDAARRLTFRLEHLDAGAFVQQLDLPNVSATGTFDGVLPMVFGEAGGRVLGGALTSRPPGGTIAYVGELTTARLGTVGKLAFDALKDIRYSTLAIGLDGRLDGEMVSHVDFTGVREATPDRNLLTRLISDLPFRFNITIRAPFRSLAGTARSYMDPALLLTRPDAMPQPPVQPNASGPVR